MADMSLGRYTVPDPYTLEEFRRAYQSADAQGRIRLLQRLCSAKPELGVSGASLPSSGVDSDFWRHAVEDEHVEVRQWIARHGPLHTALVERLKGDPDAFVRACLRENEGFAWFAWLRLENEFGEATHLERLALLRNPRAYHIPVDLLKTLFDFDDRTLAVDTESRKQLIRAFLTNRRAVTLKDGWGNPDHSSLWTIISRWPSEARWSDTHVLKACVYGFVKADTATKVTTYRACRDDDLRGAIVDGCGGWHRVVALALADPDDGCYLVARRKRKGRWQRLLFQRVDTRNDEASIMDAESTERVMKAIEARIRKEFQGYAIGIIGAAWLAFMTLMVAKWISTQWTGNWTLGAASIAVTASVIGGLAWLGRRWWAYRCYVSLGGTRSFLSHLDWRFNRAVGYSEVERETALYKTRED